MKMIKEDGAPEADMEFVKEMLKTMTMEIGAKQMVMTNAGEETKASYVIEDSNEEKNWIKVKVEMDGQPEPKTGEFTVLGEDLLKLKADDGTMLFFARIEEEKKSEDDG